MGLRHSIVAALLAAPIGTWAFPIATPGTEGWDVVAGGGDVVATYLGHAGWYSTDLELVTDDGINGNDIFVFNNYGSAIGSTVNLGAFAAGTRLLFRLHVKGEGDNTTYFTGDSGRNPDGAFHARVQEDWAPHTTLVSFEDAFNGPFGFDDLSFSLSNPSTTAVSEPASALLFGLGVAGVAAARRLRHLRKT